MLQINLVGDRPGIAVTKFANPEPKTRHATASCGSSLNCRSPDTARFDIRSLNRFAETKRLIANSTLTGLEQPRLSVVKTLAEP